MGYFDTASFWKNCDLVCIYLKLKIIAMTDEIMNFDLPVEKSSTIKVLGIGGGGSNAVNYMYQKGIKDVNFVVCNTDAQALNTSPVPVKIQIGESLTEGRGAGNIPEIGKQAALENMDDIINAISSNTKMVFLTAGMGGGTGTGAAPVIAKATREAGILAVAIVTIPFKFEGQKRINQAIEGINELSQYVDSLLVINNEKLREIFGDLKLSEAFGHADNVLTIAAKGIAEIITVHGYINVDFADVQTVMTNSGVAIMGTGVAEGEGRALKAIEQAVTSPLLNSNDITGAKSILLNISSGSDEISMDEVGEITDYLNELAAEDVQLIWGTSVDESLEAKVVVTIIATGFEANSIPELYVKSRSRKSVTLSENSSDERKWQDTIFEIKDKDLGTYRVDEYNNNQRTINFNMRGEDEKPADVNKNPDHNPLNQSINSEKNAERIRKIKETHSIIKEKGLKNQDIKDNIDELEDEPAYIRRNINIKNDVYSSKSKVSRYSLGDEEDNEDKRLEEKISSPHHNTQPHMFILILIKLRPAVYYIGTFF